MKTKVTRMQLFRWSLSGRCPNCGSSSIWQHLLRLKSRCPACGLLAHRSDGFFLGPLSINYGVTVFFCLPAVLLAYQAGWLGYRAAVVTAVVIAVVFPMVFYRFAWGLWFLAYYWLLPHELPANETELIPVNEDE